MKQFIIIIVFLGLRISLAAQDTISCKDDYIIYNKLSDTVIWAKPILEKKNCTFVNFLKGSKINELIVKGTFVVNIKGEMNSIKFSNNTRKYYKIHKKVSHFLNKCLYLWQPSYLKVLNKPIDSELLFYIFLTKKYIKIFVYTQYINDKLEIYSTIINK